MSLDLYKVWHTNQNFYRLNEINYGSFFDKGKGRIRNLMSLKALLVYDILLPNVN